MERICTPSSVKITPKIMVWMSKTTRAEIWRGPGSSQKTRNRPAASSAPPGSRKSQFGAYSSMNRRCRQPSRKLGKCGGRPRLSGHSVMGISVMRALICAALMTNSEANSITLWPDKRGRPPHLRSFRDGWRHLRFMLLYAPNWLFLLPGGALLAAGLFLVFWLLPGPRQISARVVLDIHTMIFGVIFTLLGVQILSIGSFAKVFSYAERFDRNPVSLKRLLKRVKLETGLLVGGSLFLAGFAGCAWVAWKWAASGFGPLHEVRKVLFWSMWLFIGVQVTFASFFLSMLGISRGTYIGDYDLH